MNESAVPTQTPAPAPATHLPLLTREKIAADWRSEFSFLSDQRYAELMAAPCVQHRFESFVDRFTGQEREAAVSPRPGSRHRQRLPVFRARFGLSRPPA